jgi:hypothetical protein
MTIFQSIFRAEIYGTPESEQDLLHAATATPQICAKQMLLNEETRPKRLHASNWLSFVIDLAPFVSLGRVVPGRSVS